MLLLEKTGTITLVNRQASDFIPLAGVAIEDLADRAQLASLADETAEGRSIVVLAKTLAESLGGHVMKLEATDVAEAILATAQQERVTMIIIGQSERSWWHRMLHGSVTARILSGAHRTDVLVASFDPPQE